MATIDLGGGSVQLAHALPEAAAAAAPPGCASPPPPPSHPHPATQPPSSHTFTFLTTPTFPPRRVLAPPSYVRELRASSSLWHVYVHSYLGYGLMAARSAVLRAGAPPAAALSPEANAAADGAARTAADAAAAPHACLAAGVQLEYAGGRVAALPASPADAASSAGCAALADAALRLGEACEAAGGAGAGAAAVPPPAGQCGFAGAWGGGGGPGAASFVASSYLWDRAAQAGLVPPAPPGGEEPIDAVTTPGAFAAAAERACASDGPDPAQLRAALPGAPGEQPDAALFCLDLAYCARLLGAAFGLGPERPLTLVKRVRHRGQPVEAAWPLGAALNALG